MYVCSVYMYCAWACSERRDGVRERERKRKMQDGDRVLGDLEIRGKTFTLIIGGSNKTY